MPHKQRPNFTRRDIMLRNAHYRWLTKRTAAAGERLGRTGSGITNALDEALTFAAKHMPASAQLDIENEADRLTPAKGATRKQKAGPKNRTNGEAK